MILVILIIIILIILEKLVGITELLLEALNYNYISLTLK